MSQDQKTPVAAFIADLRQYRLLDSAKLQAAAKAQKSLPDPKALAKQLVQKGWLTAYQANQVLQGRNGRCLQGQA
jgi:hypothetical protein